MSCCSHGVHAGLEFSMSGLTIVLYKGSITSLEWFEKKRRIIPSLWLAFLHIDAICLVGFKSFEMIMPRSFCSDT